MKDFLDLVDTVQHNCHITDARHARSMTMCAYLLEMQQYYRWENEIPYSASLPRSEVGEWIADRERLWSEMEDLSYSALPLCDDIPPFESESVNRLIVPEGYVYSAGYGRFGKPHFFLGKLLREENRGDYTVLISGCEYARDLTAPPAALMKNTIFLRRDAVRRMVWEKAWGRRLEGCFASDENVESLIENECEAIILHELGEGMAGELLGKGWEDMLMAAPSVRAEIVLRAVRDLLADCLSTLPVLIERNEERSLHSYFENLTGMRRELFPLFVSAYNEWQNSGDIGLLSEAVESGREHWLWVGRAILGSRNHLAETGDFRL